MFPWYAENAGRSVEPKSRYITTTAVTQVAGATWLSQSSLAYSKILTTVPNDGYTYRSVGQMFGKESKALALVRDRLMLPIASNMENKSPK